MARQTIQMPLHIPADPHGPATFIHTVQQRLAKRPGIFATRVIPKGQGDDTHTATIELDYDPEILTLNQIDQHLQQAGGRIDPSIGHLVLPIDGVLTPQNQHTVQAVLNKLPGVVASVSFASQTLRVAFDRRQCALPEIVRRLDRLGLSLGPDLTTADQAQPSGDGRWLPPWLQTVLSQRDLVLTLIGGLCLAVGAVAHGMTGPGWVWVPLLIVSYICCGWYLAPDVFKALANLHLDIDVLMLAAAGGAASLGHYEEGALLLLLFGLGNAGQRLAMNRARGAIQALARLAPQTATVLDTDGTQREVRVEDLVVGDRVLIRAGERIPADGRVVEGHSAVDQSPITGESIPIEKTAGDEAFAGTINQQGVLTVQVNKPADQHMLTKVIKLVEEAQTTKSPTQLLTNRIEQWYVPLVMVTTAVLIVLPPLLGVAPAREASLWAGWFYQAMAFLTAASPCALAIGTPAAILSGVGRAARSGVLIKGGAHLENLGRVTVMGFDKTGTLTTGRPEVTDVVVLEHERDKNQVIALAAAIERGSDHPLALAVVAEAEARQCTVHPANKIRQVPGMGIHGQVAGQHVQVGRLAMVQTPLAHGDTAPPTDSPPHTAAQQRTQQLESQGKTVMVVAVDRQPIGLIAMADQPRPGAASMITQLKQAGICHTVMLTGDNTHVAQQVAQQVGVDECLAQLLPQDKLDQVRQLDERYGMVAMVGDGVNDAPAMANATVGIAVGGALGSGSDVALETADVALLADHLSKLPEAMGISRFTRRIITQNLVIALGVILILAPLAALGQTTIYASVMFHEGSTVLVVLNALRILRHRPAG